MLLGNRQASGSKWWICCNDEEEKGSGTLVEEKRVKEIKSNFLNKYIYSTIALIILLIVVIFYFVSR